jgi:hypothetical protein
MNAPKKPTTTFAGSARQISFHYDKPEYFEKNGPPDILITAFDYIVVNTLLAEMKKQGKKLKNFGCVDFNLPKENDPEQNMYRIRASYGKDTKFSVLHYRGNKKTVVSIMINGIESIIGVDAGGTFEKFFNDVDKNTMRIIFGIRGTDNDDLKMIFDNITNNEIKTIANRHTKEYITERFIDFLMED